MRFCALLLTVAGLLAGAIASPALATFPGQNGAMTLLFSRPTDRACMDDMPDACERTYRLAIRPRGRAPYWLATRVREGGGSGFSPDGTHLAFFTSAGAGAGRRSLVAARADGSARRFVRRVRGTADLGLPAVRWSTGGTRLPINDTAGVQTVGLRGAPVRTVFADPFVDPGCTLPPADCSGTAAVIGWSSRGDVAANLFSVLGGRGKVLVRRGGAGSVRVLQLPGPGQCTDWTPDGAGLLCGWTVGEDESPDGGIIDASSAAVVRRLATSCTNRGYMSLADTVVAPDGRVIAVALVHGSSVVLCSARTGRFVASVDVSRADWRAQGWRLERVEDWQARSRPRFAG